MPVKKPRVPGPPSPDAIDAEGDGLIKMQQTERDAPKASWGDLLSLVDNDDVRVLFASGCIFAFLNGLTLPALAYVISEGLSALAGAGADDGMDGVRRTAFYFVGVGVYAFVCAGMQNACMEVAAVRTTRTFRKRWFGALLKQDAAFYDVYDPSVLALSVEPCSKKVQYGMGRKFGEGVQFVTAVAGGIVYALISSWRVALVLLAATPIVVATVYAAFRLDQDRPKRADEAYNARAAGVAKNTISSIRTVLSRNAGPEMARRYEEGTKETYDRSTAPLWRDGVVNGSIIGSCLLLYLIFTMYGSFLLYQDILSTGCDPSASVYGAAECSSSGPAVLGAMLGLAFAGQNLAQIPVVLDALSEARVGCYPAMVAIKRTEGAEAEEVVVTIPEAKLEANAKKTSVRSDIHSGDIESEETRIRAILPGFIIDSSSQGGLRPQDMSGAISFRAVSFAFPTKPHRALLDNFNLSISARSTVALVGSRGSGKSTIASLLQRFYDPTFGAIAIDGTDVRDLNVHYLRSRVRYVGADPVVFEITISANIQLGKPLATRQEIKEAAQLAGIHDFIMTLPDTYNSIVGDRGVHLSGGQMQQIAIARAIISHPRILIFDEVTAALSTKCEMAVQGVLESLWPRSHWTTIIIPSHISTVQKADVIIVMEQGKAVEIGNHEELMSASPGQYRSLIENEKSKARFQPVEADLLGIESRPNMEQASARSSRGSHQLKFCNVSFAYPTRPSKLILDGFNLSVRQGEKLALIGLEGGGKRTAFELAERFYDPTRGTVEYGEANIRGLNVTWLRQQIAYVQMNPQMLNTTIVKNIDPSNKVPQEEIEKACKMANIHNDIISLPGGYDAEVGVGGVRLSRCQKQRITIANALLRYPALVLIDEETSRTSFGGEIDQLAQGALDRLLSLKDVTAVTIAHRNSTVRAADRIAFIANGKVVEIGTHSELMNTSGGQYRKLVESQKQSEFLDVEELRRNAAIKKVEEEDEQEDSELVVEERVEKNELKAYDYQRARYMAVPDTLFLTLGVLGSIVVGGVFPAWGYLLAIMVQILYRRVTPCPSLSASGGGNALGFDSCTEYHEFVANDTRENSNNLGIYWAVVMAASLIGSAFTFWAFGVARERLNKRVRDSAFGALVRQEIAYFDTRDARTLSSQLRDDVARIHVFSGEQIRIISTNVASFGAGLTIASLTAWPMALCSLAIFPFAIVATKLEVGAFFDSEEDEKENEGPDSPGGIVLETLLNIRTVASLGIERQRYKDYQCALRNEDPQFGLTGLKSGFISALPPIAQQLSGALKFWWAGWLLHWYAHLYTFDDIVISVLSFFFAFFALGASATGVTNHKTCEAGAGRVFYLMDRKSSIDPQSQ